MREKTITVWFECNLCRGNSFRFRQVDDFIDHKKENHFTEFQKSSCIVFVEREYNSKREPEPEPELKTDPFDSLLTEQYSKIEKPPLLPTSSSFSQLSGLKMNNNSNMAKSTPNLNDALFSDLLIDSNPNPKSTQKQEQSGAFEHPRKNKSASVFTARSQYSFGIGILSERNPSTSNTPSISNKKLDLNAVFGELLNEQGFTGVGGSATSNAPKTINEMRRTELAQSMTPEQLKVKDWVQGKRKNLRALLSTLHTVVWDGCPWKPSSMSLMLQANDVKKVYRKACLAIHPDKQCGQECEELAKLIFVELNEAWNHFEKDNF